MTFDQFYNTFQILLLTFAGLWLFAHGRRAMKRRNREIERTWRGKDE